MREQLAYSPFGKLVAKLLKLAIYKQARLHWIQSVLAGHNTLAMLSKFK